MQLCASLQEFLFQSVKIPIAQVLRILLPGNNHVSGTFLVPQVMKSKLMGTLADNCASGNQISRSHASGNH